MLWQRRESILPQTLHVSIISNIICNRFSLLNGPNDLMHYDVRNFAPFVRSNIISNGPTDKLLICQLTFWHNLNWSPVPNKMAGKLVAPNTASARNQWYLKDSFFCLAQMTLYVMAKHKIPAFFVGHRTSFQAVWRYVNQPTVLTVLVLEQAVFLLDVGAVQDDVLLLLGPLTTNPDNITSHMIILVEMHCSAKFKLLPIDFIRKTQLS